MRTTLTLDEDIAARLIELQRKRGVSFKDVVNQTLRQGLEQQAAGRRRAARFAVKARDMGQRPGLNYDNVGELLEQLEGAAHR
jgi:hypothetical protein